MSSEVFIERKKYICIHTYIKIHKFPLQIHKLNMICSEKLIKLLQASEKSPLVEHACMRLIKGM